MQIKFIGAPKVFFNQEIYVRGRNNITKVVVPNPESFQDFVYYIADANSEAECIERLIALSRSARAGDQFYEFIKKSVAEFLDLSAGDSFSLLFLEFNEWWKYLENPDLDRFLSKKETTNEQKTQ